MHNLLTQIKLVIQAALIEDIGAGDVTTDCIISPELQLGDQLMAKAAGVVAGPEVLRLTFSLLDE